MNHQRVNRTLPLAIRAILRLLIGCYLRSIGRLAVHDPFAVTKQFRRGPLILTCNHASYLDSVYLSCAFRPRLTICGAKPRYFSTFAKRVVASIGNILRVESQEQFVADCSELLRAQETIVIYPEMGRYPHGMAPFKTWAAEVALKNDATIVPCFIRGSGIPPHKRVELFVGEPFRVRGTPERVTADLRGKVEYLRAAPNGSRVQRG